MGAWRRALVRSIRWLAIGAAMLLLGVQEGNARLQPYYILRNTGADGAVLKPRILFVLDTSGSMSTRAMPNASTCRWQDCESPTYAGTNRESRIAAARRAVNEVITATGDNAKFALMTFEQNDPPRGNTPATCRVGHANQRFAWITYSRYPGANWDKVTPHGYQGGWRLCQGNDTRPYPYLRWDDLGVGSAIGANGQVDEVPPSPLISTSSSDFGSSANSRRRVQWFPSFVGVRFQPNATTDPARAITDATIGDYNRGTEVYGHDFYYWPYVDGFPGYAQWDTYPDYSGEDKAGVIGANLNVQSGKLYAPFYFDFTGIPINPNAVGPATEDQATQAVIDHTSPLTYGGVDAAGYTPWASTIGPVPASPTQSNAIYAHSTVSSYLAFVNRIETPDSCAPTAAVLITDGEPYPSNEGGWRLYRRLADLRRDLGTDVYVVGFFLEDSQELNDMACAGAGACDGNQCNTPCDDAPADGWDTCANPDNNANECAFLASSADELQQVLTQILEQIGDFDVPSGPASTANEFGVSGGGAGEPIEALQTTVSARTEYPSWRGHVARELCEFRDPDSGDLLPQCVAPSPEFSDEEIEETFGPCPQSRSWDAGECLSLTAWTQRRIYTHDADNQLVPVAEDDGTASAGFIAELSTQGIVSGGGAEAQADEIAAFLLGRDAPDGWKLPGLASSAPIIVRRIPPYDPARSPTVAISDPHCGGRLLGAADGVPATLEDYAQQVWDEDDLVGLPSPHYEAQEAVIVGDDFGVLHAFQLNSGNELWGLVPRFVLRSLADKAAVGAATYGQTGELVDHSYGLSSTINRGWVYDDRDPDTDLHRWRQLAIMGMGAGGQDYLVLDLSHMSPQSGRGPVEILWTTEDAGLKDAYDQYNGETWARPALGYHVPGEVSTQTPEAYFIMGSGYPSPGGDAEQGRTVLQADALTGEIVDYAVLPPVAASDVYEPSYGTVVDPAIATHCLSRLWSEMQEVYIADPAGRLFRWDLGRETDHAADSGGRWTNAATMATALPFPACEGAGDSCTVSPSNRAESFTFAPAVSSNDRLDDVTSVTSASPLSPTDQFLVALIGGTPADDSLREGPGTSYHSSIYVLVDDHRGDASAGFSVPNGAPAAPPGTNEAYMRMALSEIERTRTIVPYPGADELVETRAFSRSTRPIRAPRIFVTGVIDQSTTGGTQPPTIIDGVEVYFIEFTVYEPPVAICDEAFFDEDGDEWYSDPGTTYTITFRLTSDIASGFDLITGAGSGGAGGSGGPADFGAGFDAGLTLTSVEQIGTGDCANGGCGPQLGNPTSPPCDNNLGGSGGTGGSGLALSVNHKELNAFTPVE